MTRLTRKKSKTGIYHIIVRGINRQIIFEDNYVKFIDTMYEKGHRLNFKLYNIMK